MLSLLKIRFSKELLFSFLFFLCFNFVGPFSLVNAQDQSQVQIQALSDSLVRQKMQEYEIPGLALGIVKDGELVYTRGYGLKRVNSSDSVTEHSVFHTASISKLFTAQAVMELIQAQKMQLSARLLDLLPDISYKDPRLEQIQILHLLNHTAGLPDIANYRWKLHHEADSSLRDYILGLKWKVRSNPGQKYLYSNLGYNVLAYVVEKLSGMSFEDYVKKNILLPRQMSHSDFRYFQIPEKLRTSPHIKKGDKILVSPVYPYTREHAGSSTLQASAWDLSQWMKHFLLELESEPLAYYSEMIQAPNTEYPFIGLGFQLSQLDQWKTIGHYGGDRGFRTYLMMVPEANLGIVVLGNCGYHEDFRQEIVHTLARNILNEQ